MKVRAATVERHSFGVRRRGYDRAEVDAVMGRLSQSLRSYEEEIDGLEARLADAEKAKLAITDSFASIQRAREELMEQTRMDSDAMMKQAEETLSRARQQAEELLAAAKTEIENLFDALTTDTKKVLAAAEQEAEERRAEATTEAEKLMQEATAEAERTRTQAKQEAAADRERTRAEAVTEAETIVEGARREHDRLANRIPDLRNALTQFEAQVHALVDLNAVEAEEHAEAEELTIAAADGSEEPAEAQTAAVNDDAGNGAAVSDSVPAPDGSGTLPEARDLIDLTEYRQVRTTPEAAEAAVEEAAEDAAPEEQVATVAASPGLERLATSHVARRVPGGESETIYQRRGGGLRRRIRAQGDDTD